jgi:hypothetical protein
MYPSKADQDAHGKAKGRTTAVRLRAQVYHLRHALECSVNGSSKHYRNRSVAFAPGHGFGAGRPRFINVEKAHRGGSTRELNVPADLYVGNWCVEIDTSQYPTAIRPNRDHPTAVADTQPTQPAVAL